MAQIIQDRVALTPARHNNSSLTYSYDANGELTGVSGTLNGSNYSVNYSYDLNGNRTMAGYQTGTGNELLSDGTYKYTYDKDGNLVSQTNIATGSVTYYTWDYRNRLVEVKQESSSGTVLNDEKFTYDVFNNRIAVSLNGTPQLYTVYDGANPYLDFNGSGQLTERYLYNPHALSQFYGQVSANGTVQWFLTDNIHSIRQVVSAGGTVLDAITYDPYGNILSQTNASNAPRFLYAGGAYDTLTGYDQFGRRYYNPSDGRWTSQDPLGFKAGDTDLYRYVFNAPTIYIDSTGLDAQGNATPTYRPGVWPYTNPKYAPNAPGVWPNLRPNMTPVYSMPPTGHPTYFNYTGAYFGYTGPYYPRPPYYRPPLVPPFPPGVPMPKPYESLSSFGKWSENPSKLPTLPPK
jgi:RHS repeat-associated protein